jgi:hypothetical protein
MIAYSWQCGLFSRSDATPKIGEWDNHAEFSVKSNREIELWRALRDEAAIWQLTVARKSLERRPDIAPSLP